MPTQLIALEYDENINMHTSHRKVEFVDVRTVHDDCFASEEKMSDKILEHLSHGIIFVLYKKEKPIGMFIIERKTRDIAFLTTFGIIKEHQRKGIGTELFQYMRDLIHRMDIERVLFDSHKSEEGNTEFYTKQEGTYVLDDAMEKCIIWATRPNKV